MTPQASRIFCALARGESITRIADSCGLSYARAWSRLKRAVGELERNNLRQATQFVPAVVFTQQRRTGDRRSRHSCYDSPADLEPAHRDHDDHDQQMDEESDARRVPSLAREENHDRWLTEPIGAGLGEFGAEDARVVEKPRAASCLTEVGIIRLIYKPGDGIEDQRTGSIENRLVDRCRAASHRSRRRS